MDPRLLRRMVLQLLLQQGRPHSAFWANLTTIIAVRIASEILRDISRHQYWQELQWCAYMGRWLMNAVRVLCRTSRSYVLLCPRGIIASRAQHLHFSWNQDRTEAVRRKRRLRIAEYPTLSLSEILKLRIAQQFMWSNDLIQFFKCSKWPRRDIPDKLMMKIWKNENLLYISRGSSQSRIFSIEDPLKRGSSQLRIPSIEDPLNRGSSQSRILSIEDPLKCRSSQSRILLTVDFFNWGTSQSRISLIEDPVNQGSFL